MLMSDHRNLVMVTEDFEKNKSMMQGEVLSPILFSLYVNDFENYVNDFENEFLCSDIIDLFKI